MRAHQQDPSSTCRASLSSAIATTSTKGCVLAGKAARTEAARLAADSRVWAPSSTSSGPWHGKGGVGAHIRRGSELGLCLASAWTSAWPLLRLCLGLYLGSAWASAWVACALGAAPGQAGTERHGRGVQVQCVTRALGVRLSCKGSCAQHLVHLSGGKGAAGPTTVGLAMPCCIVQNVECRSSDRIVCILMLSMRCQRSMHTVASFCMCVLVLPKES